MKDMDVNKRSVKEVLREHAGMFMSVWDIEQALNLKGDKSMRKVSGYLSRLRRDSDIERKRKGRAFEYRFKKSAIENVYSKVIRTETGEGGKGGLDMFISVEPLPEITEGYCELCDKHTQIAFKAEKEHVVVFLCKNHGLIVDRYLYGNGGRF